MEKLKEYRDEQKRIEEFKKQKLLKNKIKCNYMNNYNILKNILIKIIKIY